MKTLMTLGAVAAFGLAGLGWYRGSDAMSIASIESFAITTPSNPTQSEISAFSEALAKNQPLPSGWQITANEGEVHVVDTGVVVDATGERSWIVTIIDDQADLSSATVYVNDQAIYAATRLNGGIVDRSPLSIATLPVLVPPAAGLGWHGKVEWIANDGSTRASWCRFDH